MILSDPTIIAKSSINTNRSFYPVLCAILRLFSIIFLKHYSRRTTRAQDLWDINQEISFGFGILSSIFAIVSIVEFHKEMYAILGYEKYLSIIISLTLGISSEIIWVSLANGNNIVYFHGMGSLPLYFINFSMFVYTSLILLIEYRYKAYPNHHSAMLKYKLAACISISAELLMLSACYYYLGFGSVWAIANEYLLVFTNLGYFLTFSYDLSGNTFSENREKECEYLYTTAF